MLKNQRHSEILEILKQESFADVRSLGERLYASQPTIRRDLDLLEKKGFIKRSHGGATLADGKMNTPVSFRKGTKAKEKGQICKLASTLIESESLIFIDASTTASHLADHIGEDLNVTVVTNGYPVCIKLAEKRIRVFSTGGKFVQSSLAFVGSQAEEASRKFNAEWFFFSSSSFDDEGIISDFSEEENSLRRVMYDGAQNRVFLCDSGKFGKRSAFRAFSLEHIDYIVTDMPISEDLLEKFNYTLVASDEQAFMYKNGNNQKSE